VGTAGQLTGYAYGANIGWIELDTAFSDLASTSIRRPDTDGDGMSDYWENMLFGNLTSATSDRDGDGGADAAEYTAGTDPLNPFSNLRILTHNYTAGQTQATLLFTSVATCAGAGIWADSSSISHCTIRGSGADGIRSINSTISMCKSSGNDTNTTDGYPASGIVWAGGRQVDNVCDLYAPAAPAP
jgi:Bacterial TSP3 repeat